MKRLTIVVMILLALSSVAYAHYHAWSKQNEQQGVDAYGNQVTICSWKCVSDIQHPHFTQTQGSGFCPTP